MPAVAQPGGDAVKLHRLAILAIAALFAPALSWAVPVCTAVNFSASTSGTPASQVFTLPTSHASGDLDLIVAASRGETVSTPPSGYTLLKAIASGAFVVYGKIDGGSESNPTVVWSSTNMHVGFMLSLRSSTGWPAIGSIVVDSAAGTSTSTVQRYRSLTVSTDNTCAVQASAKNTTTLLASPTVNLTSGYTAGGLGFNNSASSLVVSAQFQSQGAKADLTQNDETINGNSDSASSNGVAFTLAMNAATAPTFSVSPAIGTRTTSSIPVTATTSCTDCTMYGIEQTAGNSAPSVTQIKAGQNGAGSAAFKTCSVALTATVQGTCTFSSITDGTVKDQYFALNSTANGDIASAVSIANAYKLPAFTAGPTFSSTSTGGATYSVTLDGAGTIYGVACKAGSTAATVAQVEAGQCTGGVAAEVASNTSGSSLVIGTVQTLPIYDFDIVGTYGSQHEAAIHADNNRLLTAPSNCGGNGTTACQYITIASIGAGSPVEQFNNATNPDIAPGDILKAPTVTHPGSYALTIGTDGQFSYSGDTSRQDALNIAVYDYSAQGFHSDDIDFWANNLPPVPPDIDSVSFFWQSGTPIAPIDLNQYSTDPEGDARTTTAVSGLGAGLTIDGSGCSPASNSCLHGTPTTPGITTLTLQTCDITGDCVTWH